MSDQVYYCKQCGTEYTPKRSTAQFCSPACRVAHNRDTSRMDSVSVTREPLVSVTDLSVTDSVTRNPLAVPGDKDYRGVCIEVDGQWVVRPEPAPTGIKHVLTKHDLGSFRGSRPYWLGKDTGLSHLSCEQLHRRLVDLKQWQGSAEYAERVYRLVHGLTSHSVPANIVAEMAEL